MILYEEIKEISWTNYYIPLGDNCEIPVFYSEDELVYLPINYIILGRPGSVCVTKDLNLFMMDVENVLTFHIDNLREEVKTHIIDFPPKDIIDWLINNYKSEYIISRLKLGNYNFE